MFLLLVRLSVNGRLLVVKLHRIKRYTWILKCAGLGGIGAPDPTWFKGELYYCSPISKILSLGRFGVFIFVSFCYFFFFYIKFETCASFSVCFYLSKKIYFLKLISIYRLSALPSPQVTLLSFCSIDNSRINGRYFGVKSLYFSTSISLGRNVQ